MYAIRLPSTMYKSQYRALVNNTVSSIIIQSEYEWTAFLIMNALRILSKCWYKQHLLSGTVLVLK